MILTEAEAKAKICPVLMVCSHANIGECVASTCMWWRWEDPAEHVRIDGLPPDAYHSEDLLPPRGYCAAAGRLATWRAGGVK